MSFKLPYDLIIADLEASQPANLVIEIGAIKLMRDGSIGDQFSSLVHVPGFLGMCNGVEKSVTELTGIDEAMLSYAPSFEDVMDKFYKWAISQSKNVVLASWGNYDTTCLINNCKYYGIDFPFRRKSMDMKSVLTFTSTMFGKKFKNDGLDAMLDCYDIEWDNSIGTKHRALPDAYHTAKLVQKCIQEYEEAKKQIQCGLDKI